MANITGIFRKYILDFSPMQISKLVKRTIYGTNYIDETLHRYIDDVY